MTKYLIINADDYGYSPGVSLGIRQSYLDGIVTSTSAMMNGQYIDQELPALINQCPDIGAGVHLVITAGTPLLALEALPGFKNLLPDGYFISDGIADIVDQFDPAEVKAEWRAQIEKFTRLAGRTPDHLDAHHHAMCFNERIFKVYLELADEFHCAVRRPVAGSPQIWYQMAQDQRVPIPERLDTRFYDEGVTETMLDVMIADLPEGVSEWMCHPACVDDYLMNSSDYHTRRADELALLTHRDLRQKIEAMSISLITFGQFSELDRKMV
ncbi:MAG: ChbG/HpnK family deacetylase [Anaerolineaceae bacterium]|nr:ChbG/HpnK family deacetylase [Anaerolineaceae bacterium]MBN2676706.1 ChbG/HpnK family deacetylase [Anaerolineaceae bacterium]